MIAQITRADTRRYRDNGQRMAYVEWIDARRRPGRTEGRIGPPRAAARTACAAI